ncbi:13620_t:CDS:2, partial [Funneliformis geosporum]
MQGSKLCLPVTPNFKMLTEKLTSEEKMKLNYTERLQMHKPCGYCYVVVCMNSSLNYENQRGAYKYSADLSASAEMIMMPGDLKAYNEATECWVCAMTQYMPTEILGKVASEKIPDIKSIASNAEIGYILEVDLEVPVHLHDFFADYSLAPEKQIVPEDWLSLYNERLVYDKEVG